MRLPLAILTFSTATLLTQTSEAQEWVERSLTLKPFAFAGDIGFGMGRNVDEPAPSFGASFEAKLGLPLGLEAGFRIGERFSDQATGANADAYGRIHDPFSLDAEIGRS